MLVKEIMTKGLLVWCEAQESAEAAAKMMKEKSVGFVPVLEDADSRKVVGVITDRDICLRAVANGLDPRFATIEECMTSSVVSCRPESGVNQVLEIMQKNRVRRLPVVDARDRLVGVISMDDLVLRDAAEPKKLMAALKAIYRPAKTRVTSSAA
jgi:CBS domain-containing protein